MRCVCCFVAYLHSPGTLNPQHRFGVAFLQVPAQGWLKAAVRTDEAQQAVTRNTEEVSIPPKPVIMHQDVSIFCPSVLRCRHATGSQACRKGVPPAAQALCCAATLC